MKARQTDAFDGVFDDPARRVREVVRDGVVKAAVSAAGIACPLARQLGIDQPFGHYPARPAAPAERRTP